MPDGHHGVDLLLPQRRRRRDAMMSVADEVDRAELDQLDRRQAEAVQIGPGDTYPAGLGVALERAKRAVEIVAAPLAAVDLPDRHRLCSSGAAVADRAGGGDRREVEQPT